MGEGEEADALPEEDSHADEYLWLMGRKLDPGNMNWKQLWLTNVVVPFIEKFLWAAAAPYSSGQGDRREENR